MTDPINYHPHSRYTLHEKANLFPFKDLIWQKTDGPFIDLKIDFPDPTNFYADGTAFLRVEDVVEMAHVLGMATREEVEKLKQENEELKAKLLQLPTKVESFKNDLSRTTTEFLATLDSTVPLVVADVEAESNAKPTFPKGRVKTVHHVSEADIRLDKGLGTDHRSTSKPDDSAEQSGDESVSGKGPDELSGSVSNPAGDPLADFFGLGPTSK